MSKERLDSEEIEEIEDSDEWDEDGYQDDGYDGDEEEVEVYTLEDEDGNESEFTLIKRLDVEGSSYVAFEYFNEEDYEGTEDEDSFVILKVVSEDGEEVFVTIEDDEEFDKVADIFEDMLMEEMADGDFEDE